jgi:hypothetical protein
MWALSLTARSLEMSLSLTSSRFITRFADGLALTLALKGVSPWLLDFLCLELSWPLRVAWAFRLTLAQAIWTVPLFLLVGSFLNLAGEFTVV